MFSYFNILNKITDGVPPKERQEFGFISINSLKVQVKFIILLNYNESFCISEMEKQVGAASSRRVIIDEWC